MSKPEDPRNLETRLADARKDALHLIMNKQWSFARALESAALQAEVGFIDLLLFPMASLIAVRDLEHVSERSDRVPVWSEDENESCRYPDCPYEVVERVTITLPDWLGPFHVLSEEERKRRIHVCAQHVAILEQAVANGVHLT